MVSSVPLLFFAIYCVFFWGGGWLCCEVAIFLMLRCLVGLNIRRFCDVAIAGCPVEAGICVDVYKRQTVGRAVGSLADAQPGDIIANAQHAAIYVGNGMVINSQLNGTRYDPIAWVFPSSYSIRRIF